MSNVDKDALRVIYQEICNRLSKIDDFRAKLLGYLPLASGAGLFLLFNNSFANHGFKEFIKPYFLIIGIFGFLITLGLYFYEIRGIQRCNFLKEMGAIIENHFRIPGQFNVDLPPAAKFVGATSAALVIYPAVLSAWAFVAFIEKHKNPEVIAATVLLSTLIFSLLLNLKFNINDQAKSDCNLDAILKNFKS